MIQGVVREFVEREALPLIPDCVREGRVPASAHPAAGRAGRARADDPALRLGAGLHQLWADLPGARARRLGLAQLRLGAGQPGDVSDLGVRLGRAEGALPARACTAASSIGCFGLTEHEHGSDPSGMETRAVRDGDGYVLNGGQDVDHQRQPGRRGPGLGQGGRGWPGHRARVSGRDRLRRVLRPTRSSTSCQPARVGDQRAGAAGRARVVERACCPGVAGCADRCRRSTRRASGSSSAWSARRWRATRRRSSTRGCASSLVDRSAASS